MMKHFLLFALVLLTGSAIAAETNSLLPIVFGRLNKEIQYVSQDSAFKESKYRMGTDVINYESVFGFKNEYTIADTMKAGYYLELGPDTIFDGNIADDQADGTTTQSTDYINLRFSYVHFSDFWGKISLGKTTTATAALFGVIDPLYNSSASMAGYDQTTLIAGSNVAGKMGYWYRSRKNLVGYTSPEIGGFKIDVTLDRNGTYGLREEVVNHYLEAVASYNLKQENMNLKVYAGLVNLMPKNVRKTTGTYTSKDMAYLAAANFNMKPFTVTFVYESETSTIQTIGQTTETKPVRGWLSGSFKMNLSQSDFVALTYASNTYDSKASASTTKEKRSQIALGYQHGFNDQVSARIVAGKFDVKDLNSNILGVNDKKKNSATFASLGATVTF